MRWTSKHLLLIAAIVSLVAVSGSFLRQPDARGSASITHRGSASISASYGLMLAAEPEEGGTVRSLTPGDLFLEGQVVMVEALPADGWVLTGWSGAPDSETVCSYRVSSRGNCLTARFCRVKAHPVEANADPPWAGTVYPPQVMVKHGDSLRIVARETNDGYRFERWRGHGSVDQVLDLRITEPLRIVAEFVEVPMTDKLVSDGILEALGLNGQGRPEYRHRKTGIVLVLIPAGEFIMGSSEDCSDNRGYEIAHSVTLTRSFLLGKYEVTNDQFRMYDSHHKSVGPTNRVSGEQAPVDSGDKPVVGVSHDAALAFCRWAGLQLPTEAQWEYAAGAGKSYKYPWGNDWPAPNRLGNTTYDESERTTGKSMGHTLPVGRFPPSELGLHDMVGNASEWCADWYAGYVIRCVADPQGPPVGIERVVRGSSWIAFPVSPRIDARCGTRSAYPPDLRSDPLDDSKIGFRAALYVEATDK